MNDILALNVSFIYHHRNSIFKNITKTIRLFKIIIKINVRSIINLF